MSTQTTRPPLVSGRRSSAERRKSQPQSSKTGRGDVKPTDDTNPTAHFWTRLLVGSTILVVGIIGYWPTLVDLANTWSSQADYSHGYVVAPIAAYLLWLRKGSFPGLQNPSLLLAAVLVTISVAMRYCAGRFFYGFLDGWSLIPWVASIAVAIGGHRVLLWAMPSIAFLVFMVPLPFSLENELSYPLQRIATFLSTSTLQLLGFAAFADGNVILLGDDRLEVAQACSGLRLFMSILALTYVYMAVIHRPWWEKLALAMAAVPVAILSNAARIVATGVVYQYSDSEAIRKLVHDSAGWATILFAACLFWVFLWYLRKLIREDEIFDAAALVRMAKTESI
jgi:exosortase